MIPVVDKVYIRLWVDWKCRNGKWATKIRRKIITCGVARYDGSGVGGYLEVGGIIGTGLARRKGPQPEARQPSPHQLGDLMEHYKLLSGVSGWSPDRLIVLAYFRCSRWLFLLHFRVHFQCEECALTTGLESRPHNRKTDGNTAGK